MYEIEKYKRLLYSLEQHGLPIAYKLNLKTDFCNKEYSFSGHNHNVFFH